MVRVAEPPHTLPRYTLFRVLLAAFFITAGVFHFVYVDFFLRMMPSYVPWHKLMVDVSGVAEIALGAGLLVPHVDVARGAAWGLIALLVAVFPANVNMAFHPADFPSSPVWALWFRLPMQGVLLWWAYRYTRPRR